MLVKLTLLITMIIPPAVDAPNAAVQIEQFRHMLRGYPTVAACEDVGNRVKDYYKDNPLVSINYQCTLL